MSEKSQGLESLEIWRMAVDYAVNICQIVIPLFPQEEKWALASQMRRAVQSITANIAEGYGRFHYHETIHFCYIAPSSKVHNIAEVGSIQQRLGKTYNRAAPYTGSA